MGKGFGIIWIRGEFWNATGGTQTLNGLSTVGPGLFSQFVCHVAGRVSIVSAIVTGNLMAAGISEAGEEGDPCRIRCALRSSGVPPPPSPENRKTNPKRLD